MDHQGTATVGEFLSISIERAIIAISAGGSVTVTDGPGNELPTSPLVPIADAPSSWDPASSRTSAPACSHSR